MWSMDALPLRIASKLEQDGECWRWTANKNGDGPYGSVTWEGQSRRAHRVIYELLVGPIPDGHVLDHLLPRDCIGTLCCWPGHVEPVTGEVNMLRGVSGPAVNARKEVCIRGHRLVGENVRVRIVGGRQSRQCVPCHRAWRELRDGGKSMARTVRADRSYLAGEEATGSDRGRMV